MEMWSALKKSLPRLLEEAPPDALIALTKELSEMRASVCARHPDVCQICSAEIVPMEERVCDCAGRVCYGCAGKTITLDCPQCRSNALLLPLIAADKVPITFSAMARSDYAKFKPELYALLKSAQQHDEGQQRISLESEARADWSSDDDSEDEPARAATPPPTDEPDEEEEKEHSSNQRQEGQRPARARPAAAAAAEEEPPTRRQRTEGQEPQESEGERKESNKAKEEKKEEKVNKEINRLLEFCSKHGDQRTFGELLAGLSELRGWNQQQINNDSADGMDLATIKEQWFLTTCATRATAWTRWTHKGTNSTTPARSTIYTARSTTPARRKVKCAPVISSSRCGRSGTRLLLSRRVSSAGDR